jgi:hypothetical protein
MASVSGTTPLAASPARFSTTIPQGEKNRNNA